MLVDNSSTLIKVLKTFSLDRAHVTFYGDGTLGITSDFVRVLFDQPGVLSFPVKPFIIDVQPLLNFLVSSPKRSTISYNPDTHSFHTWVDETFCVRTLYLPPPLEDTTSIEKVSNSSIEEPRVLSLHHKVMLSQCVQIHRKTVREGRRFPIILSDKTWFFSGATNYIWDEIPGVNTYYFREFHDLFKLAEHIDYGSNTEGTTVFRGIAGLPTSDEESDFGSFSFEATFPSCTYSPAHTVGVEDPVELPPHFSTLVGLRTEMKSPIEFVGATIKRGEVTLDFDTPPSLDGQSISPVVCSALALLPLDDAMIQPSARGYSISFPQNSNTPLLIESLN